MHKIRKIGSQCLLLLLSMANNLRADDSRDAGQPYFAMPTIGGKQFWADELFFHQWRIQRNVLTGHCRLLDEHDRRHSSGTYSQCRQALERIKSERHLPPMRGKAVIVLHGLFRSRSSMDSLCHYLATHGGYEVFNVTYPSTQYDVAQHAQSLAHIIDNLDGIDELGFVAHSMGNIVVRHYLRDFQKNARANEEPLPADSSRPKRPKFGRFVMLAPPNHEAQMATALADNMLFKALSGQSGQQLGRRWKDLEGELAVPDFEFAIIAGGKDNGKGYNPWLAGDNDGTISVETTKLAGAADFTVMPALHTFIMNDTRVQEMTLNFLQYGYFVSKPERHPLEK